MLGNVRNGDLPLVLRTKKVRIVDYYTVPWDDVRAGTPAAVMIASRELVTGMEEVFAWHLVAEREGIPPEQILCRRGDLEGRVLADFHGHVRENPKVWWIHWGLNSVEFGFPALVQRASALGLGEVRFPERRLLNLAELLKQRLGENYVPHKRLGNLIRLNDLNDHQLLDQAGLAEAFRAGDFCRMLRSLRRKLYCIGRILELFLTGNLKITADPSPLSLVLPQRPDVPWMACARAVLANSRRVHLEGSSRRRGREGQGGVAPGTAAHPVQASFASPDDSPPTIPLPAAPPTQPTEIAPDIVVSAAPQGGGAPDTSESSGLPRLANHLFIPSELQRQILQKLNGKALTLDALAAKLQVDRSRVHRDGLKELMAQGFVTNHRRVGGYYRPDAPPPELRDLLGPDQAPN
jgi:hypothetical protein